MNDSWPSADATLTFGQVSGGFAASATRTATLDATVPLVDDLGNPAGTAIVALTLKRTLITYVFNDHTKEVQLATFAGGLTSAGIVQESTGSVDIQKK